MWIEIASRLGIGVVLAWAALPVLGKLARRSRTDAPAAYYRALLAALSIATALIVLPLVRTWSSAAIALLRPSSSVHEPSTVTFVTDFVGPLISTAKSTWSAPPVTQLFAALGGIWLLLLAAGLCLSIAGHLRLRRNYGHAARAPERVLARAQHIASELGVRAPAIRVASGNLGAFTYGAFSPVIIVSESACELPDDELDFVLRHELCHIARHDTRAMCLIDFAQRCFLGHPSLPALAHEIRVAREARADRAAAGARSLEYARFLLTVAQRIDSLRTQSGSLVSMADTALERRVEMLIEPHRSRLERSSLWLALAGLSFGSIVLLTPASFGQTDKPNDHPTVKGNLSVEQVEQALFSKAQPMLSCYNGLAAPRANLPVHLSFEIDETGRVSSGRVSAPDHPELEPCLRAALLQKTFPRPSSGTVSVEAPTLLTPPYDERRAVLEAREGTSQSLSKDVIRTTIRSYFPQLRQCFEQVGAALPSAKIDLGVVIGRDGKVIDGDVVDKSEPAADRQAFDQLAKCVDNVRRTMQFPAPDDGVVTVSYPIEFGHTPSSEY